MSAEVLDLKSTTGQRAFVQQAIIRLIDLHRLDPGLVIEEIQKNYRME